MRIWHGKVAVSLAVYLAFIYAAQLNYGGAAGGALTLRASLFRDNLFFLVFPIMFIWNAPPLYSRNALFLLRLHKKGDIFRYGANRMVAYSFVYVTAVTLFVFAASLLMGSVPAASVTITSFTTNLLSACIMSGFITVGSLYIDHQKVILAAYSAAVVMVSLPLGMFFDRLTTIDFLYIGMSPDLRHAGLYVAVYAANFCVIGILYFLYDIREERDLA